MREGEAAGRGVGRRLPSPGGGHRDADPPVAARGREAARQVTLQLPDLAGDAAEAERDGAVRPQCREALVRVEAGADPEPAGDRIGGADRAVAAVDAVEAGR